MPNPSPQPLYIGGSWVTTPATRLPTNPATGAALTPVCLASDAEVDAATSAAVAAAEPLRRLSGGDRAQLLADLADAVSAASDDLANLITAESGKPLPLAQGEVARGLQTLRLGAEEATRIGGEVVPLDRTEKGRGRVGVTRRFPIGPVLGITPFNFPLNLALHKLAPALAAGCPIVLKAADQTPGTLLRLAELIHGLDGLPPGSVSVVNCAVPQSARLVADPRYALLSFTGSPAIGFQLKRDAGKKRVLLELGGNAAVYVDASADLDHAAERITFGALAYSGQVCISVQRIYAHEAIHEALRSRLVERFEAAPAGGPRDPGVVVVPLIDERAAQRVEGLIEDALAQDAVALVGGARQGSRIPATLLEGVPETARANTEEAFGPLATLAPVESAEEAFARINASRFGLQAGVFSNDLQQVLRAHDELVVGAVVHDDVPTFRVDEMPYGGVKDSGLGREGLRHACEEMTEPRLLILRRGR